MSLESLHNYFVITVKSRKNDDKIGFYDFWLWSRNNVGITATLWLSPVNFIPKNTMVNFFFHKKKKKFVRHPKMVVFRFWDRTWDPFREPKFFFSQNLTYSCSFLGWNLPGITMSLKSLHNYFVITVKSRKNDEKIGFYDFWLWSRNNVGIIATLWLSPVNFIPKNTMVNFFFHKKKKNSSDIPKWSFSDFETEPETPFGNRKFFFLKI